YLIHYLEDSWNEMRGLGKRLLLHFPDDADLQQAYLGEVRALVRDRAEVKASNRYADRMVQLKRWTPTQRQSHETDMQIRLYMRYKTESDRQNAISACESLLKMPGLSKEKIALTQDFLKYLKAQ